MEDRILESLFSIPQEDLDTLNASFASPEDCDHDSVMYFDAEGMFCSECGEYLSDDGEYIPNHYEALTNSTDVEAYDLWREEQDLNGN